MSTTFHESYGELTLSLLGAIDALNVSPADYDMIVDLYEMYGRQVDFDQIERFVRAHSKSGMYQAPWPMPAEEVFSA